LNVLISLLSCSTNVIVLRGECNGHTNIDGKYVRGVYRVESHKCCDVPQDINKYLFM
jgi:hypothetical protein